MHYIAYFFINITYHWLTGMYKILINWINIWSEPVLERDLWFKKNNRNHRNPKVIDGSDFQILNSRRSFTICPVDSPYICSICFLVSLAYYKNRCHSGLLSTTFKNIPKSIWTTEPLVPRGAKTSKSSNCSKFLQLRKRYRTWK